MQSMVLAEPSSSDSEFSEKENGDGTDKGNAQDDSHLIT